MNQTTGRVLLDAYSMLVSYLAYTSILKMEAMRSLKYCLFSPEYEMFYPRKHYSANGSFLIICVASSEVQ
jgi:hypothetical protein